MVLPIHGHAVIYINATVDQYRKIIPDMLAAHGLTVCDTVATYFGIRKSLVHAISYISDASRVCQRSPLMQHHSFWPVMARLKVCHWQRHARKYWQAQCAGVWLLHQSFLPCLQQMRHLRKLWPALTFTVWRNAMQPDPQRMDQTSFGWSRKDGFKTLFQQHASQWHSPRSRWFTETRQMFLQ